MIWFWENADKELILGLQLISCDTGVKSESDISKKWVFGERGCLQWVGRWKRDLKSSNIKHKRLKEHEKTAYDLKVLWIGKTKHETKLERCRWLMSKRVEVLSLFYFILWLTWAFFLLSTMDKTLWVFESLPSLDSAFLTRSFLFNGLHNILS